jgi:hypothetical protein
MSLSMQDIARLRWPLILTATAVAAGAAMILASRHLVQAAETAHRQLAAQQGDLRTRISRAREEEADLRDRIALFNQLRARGIIGQEERLDWVEQIARIKAKRRLLDLQYELSPQHAVDDTLLSAGPTAGGYEFMASTMKLKMTLLHEDDLLGFLDDLRSAVHARLLVRECTIDRSVPSQDPSGLAGQLRAACTIEWITLREKKS